MNGISPFSNKGRKTGDTHAANWLIALDSRAYISSSSRRNWKAIADIASGCYRKKEKYIFTTQGTVFYYKNDKGIGSNPAVV